MTAEDIQLTSRFCRNNKLSIGGLAILMTIQGQETMKLKEVSRLIGVSPAALTTLVQRLVEMKLIFRKSNMNRRIVTPALTEKGRIVLGQFTAFRNQPKSTS